MADTKKIFEALPHVNEIWLTDDGHFHLHPHYGGKKVERGDEPKEKKVVKTAEADKK